MTEGHMHWRVRVPSFDTCLMRLLRAPLYVQPDMRKVETSPYPYGVRQFFDGEEMYEVGTLSLLGILHRWTGLTLVLDDTVVAEMHQDYEGEEGCGADGCEGGYVFPTSDPADAFLCHRCAGEGPDFKSPCYSPIQDEWFHAYALGSERCVICGMPDEGDDA